MKRTHSSDEGAQTKGLDTAPPMTTPLGQHTGVSPAHVAPPQATRGAALGQVMSSPSDVLIPPHATTRAATRKAASTGLRIL